MSVVQHQIQDPHQMFVERKIYCVERINYQNFGNYDGINDTCYNKVVMTIS